MSPMATDASSTRRPRRRFTDEFKAGAVRLVLDEGKTVGRVARDLDLTESALRTWVDQARADQTNGRTGLTTEEREELRRLRKENRVLQTEREILKNCRRVSPFPVGQKLLVRVCCEVPEGSGRQLFGGMTP